MADFTLQVRPDTQPLPSLAWTAGPSSLTELFTTESAIFSIALDRSRLQGNQSATWVGTPNGAINWLIGSTPSSTPAGYSYAIDANGNLVITAANDATSSAPFIRNFAVNVTYTNGDNPSQTLTSPDPTIVNIDPTNPGN